MNALNKSGITSLTHLHEDLAGIHLGPPKCLNNTPEQFDDYQVSTTLARRLDMTGIAELKPTDIRPISRYLQPLVPQPKRRRPSLVQQRNRASSSPDPSDMHCSRTRRLLEHRLRGNGQKPWQKKWMVWNAYAYSTIIHQTPGSTVMMGGNLLPCT